MIQNLHDYAFPVNSRSIPANSKLSGTFQCHHLWNKRDQEAMWDTEESVRLGDAPSSSAPMARLWPGVRAAASDTELWSQCLRAGGPCQTPLLIWVLQQHCHFCLVPRLEYLESPVTHPLLHFPHLQIPTSYWFHQFFPPPRPAASIFWQDTSLSEDHHNSPMLQLSPEVPGLHPLNVFCILKSEFFLNASAQITQKWPMFPCCLEISLQFLYLTFRSSEVLPCAPSSQLHWPLNNTYYCSI